MQLLRDRGGLRTVRLCSAGPGSGLDSYAVAGKLGRLLRHVRRGVPIAETFLGIGGREERPKNPGGCVREARLCLGGEAAALGRREGEGGVGLGLGHCILPRGPRRGGGGRAMRQGPVSRGEVGEAGVRDASNKRRTLISRSHKYSLNKCCFILSKI